MTSEQLTLAKHKPAGEPRSSFIALAQLSVKFQFPVSLSPRPAMSREAETAPGLGLSVPLLPHPPSLWSAQQRPYPYTPAGPPVSGTLLQSIPTPTLNLPFQKRGHNRS